MNTINKSANPLGWKVAHSIKESLESLNFVNENELKLSKDDYKVINNFITIAEFLFESNLNTLDIIGKDEFINLLPNKVNTALNHILKKLDINYMSFKYLINQINPIYISYVLEVYPYKVKVIDYLLNPESYQIVTELHSHKILDLKYYISDNKVVIDRKNYNLFFSLKRIIRSLEIGMINFAFYFDNPIQQMVKKCYDDFVSISNNKTISYQSFIDLLVEIGHDLKVNKKTINIYYEKNNFRVSVLELLSQFKASKRIFKVDLIDNERAFKLDQSNEFWLEYMEIILLELNTSDLIFTFTDMEEFKILVKNEYKYQILLRFYLNEDSNVLTNNEELLQEAVEYLTEIKHLIK